MLSLIVTLALFGQGANVPPLVTFDELEKRLTEPGLRLLDPRPKADYDKGHLAGAVWVDVKGAEKLAARKGGLEDKRAWAAWAEPLGISPNSKVLIYDGARQLDAARLWWLLTYLGVKNVGLVDGNFPLWKSQGRAMSTEPVSVAAKPFAVAFQTDRHATRDDVLAALKTSGKTRIIDARSEAEHTGERAMSKRAGRVPDACHLEWSTLVDREGRFLDASQLKAKVESSGIKPGEPVISHCQGGGRASVDAFVLERLGHPTRNYYLGWSDWGNAESTPVETGKPKPK